MRDRHAGIAHRELELLIAGLVTDESCLGMEVTVFDPDHDPEGAYAAEITDTLVAALAPRLAETPAPAPVAEATAD